MHSRAVNSLEGIADDVTGLPFALQDVKSEDRETLAINSTAPSRMSLHDVTRAFQQVPSSSSRIGPQLSARPNPPLNFAVNDSRARAPDSEHFKTIWSQGSDKVHSVNSLEGIADDLAGLPFTLQNVKSEDRNAACYQFYGSVSHVSARCDTCIPTSTIVVIEDRSSAVCTS